ncbi:unnamed protein product, partial [Prorocentrum cordatum]
MPGKRVKSEADASRVAKAVASEKSPCAAAAPQGALAAPQQQDPKVEAALSPVPAVGHLPPATPVLQTEEVVAPSRRTAAKSRPPTPQATVGGESGSWLYQDKATYNKFYYRAKAVPEIKEMWENEIKTTMSEADQREWVSSIISTKAGVPPDCVVQRRKELIQTQEEIKAGAWMTFHGAASKDGEVAVKEMLRFGALKSRPNSKLPPDAELKWPCTLEVARAVEKWSDATTAKKSERVDDHEGWNQDEMEEFSKATKRLSAKVKDATIAASSSGAATPGGAAPQANDGTGGQGAPPPAERDKVCVTNAKKSHTLWDRTRREWHALCVRSKSCENTRGCKIESDLETLLKELDALDQDIMGVETKFLSATALTDDDITTTANNVQQLVDKIKIGNKKATALKPWFKL